MHLDLHVSKTEAENESLLSISGWKAILTDKRFWKQSLQF